MAGAAATAVAATGARAAAGGGGSGGAGQVPPSLREPRLTALAGEATAASLGVRNWAHDVEWLRAAAVAAAVAAGATAERCPCVGVDGGCRPRRRRWRRRWRWRWQRRWRRRRWRCIMSPGPPTAAAVGGHGGSTVSPVGVVAMARTVSAASAAVVGRAHVHDSSGDVYAERPMRAGRSLGVRGVLALVEVGSAGDDGAVARPCRL